jgi:formylglycine-generating enzyme required for sulfatase activity
MKKKLFLAGMIALVLVIASCENVAGPAGVNGKDGTDGQDGISIVWKGSLAVAPANPDTNWAYYNTADGKAYIYNGTAWQILAQDGQNGVNGFSTPAAYRTMVSLAGGSITTTSGSEVFISGRSVTLSAFKIAKHETTYQLWKEVYDWALLNGYTFANPGREGHGTSGTGTVGTAAEKATRPVTNVNWRDAIVWCNAYSERSGKAPVYYTDDTYTTVLKVSTNNSGTATAADGAKMKPGADGYRLPTETEWEYAARGGNQSDVANWGYTYSGSDTVGDVAWYEVNSYDLGSSDPDYGAHPVGGKTANSKGLYDMSGNVREWCWDWHDLINAGTPETGAVSSPNRVNRDGSWHDSNCAVTYRDGDYPYMVFSTVGFRVVCP